MARTRRRSRTSGSRFNGARPRRPGVAVPNLPTDPTAYPASTEPGLVGREWLVRQEGRARVRAGFNGARPRRPGVASARRTTPASSAPRFNGARPRRPGVAVLGGPPPPGAQGASTEPGLVGREWPDPNRPRPRPIPRFNGARPRRPGVAARDGAGRVALLHASTEPGLVGREWPPRWADPFTSYGCFNGARPRRPGVARHGKTSTPRPFRCFNGARPRRPGVAAEVVAVDGAPDAASTEPGLVGREWRRQREAVGAGTRCFNGARPRRPGVASASCTSAGPCCSLQRSPAS